MTSVTAYAPGRAEVLGNHTDYNEGLVLAIAIDMGTTVSVLPLPDRRLEIVSKDLNRYYSTALEALEPSQDEPWANYVIGAAFHLRLRGIELRGARIEISSSVPLGAGLSSSAALEIASLLAFKKLCDFSLPDLEIAKVGQAAEHSHAGVQCGLLDQISSLMSKPNKLTVIDCRTLQVSHVSMSPDLVFVIVNSGVKHALVAGEYNERRASCEQAARLLGVTALRDASADLLESKKDAMPQLVWKRARHVIEENDRVRTAIKAMNSDDFTALGRSMLESHESSKRNFQNSCPELDFLVETAAKQPGCLGARLSGGGFGGATINLVERSILGQFEAEIASTYLKKFHSKPLILHTTASSGAR